MDQIAALRNPERRGHFTHSRQVLCSQLAAPRLGINSVEAATIGHVELANGIQGSTGLRRRNSQHANQRGLAPWFTFSLPDEQQRCCFNQVNPGDAQSARCLELRLG